MNKKSKLFISITKYLVALLFCYTAISKIIDFNNFVFQLEKSPLIPVGLGVFFGIAVILSELIASYYLFVKEKKGFYFSLFLMVSFTAYLYTIIHFSYYIPCSCGGVLEKLDWNTHIIFNLLFVVLIIASILLNTSSNEKTPT
ncbi:MAG: MauE/DoxX family redox-associated membrane protein [Xanthomarina gelatinilytica]|uniref:MauE/DoxX family redox-associated membrane protein n=1 Tax=Xanthomarina gelatinilytica TaxID=1137281 RepID=UPI003A88FDFF